MSINDILLFLLFTKLFYRIISYKKEVDLKLNTKYTIVNFEKIEPEASTRFKTCATPNNCFTTGFCL